MALSVTSKRADFAFAVSAFAGLRLLGVDEVLLLHLLDDLVDELFDLIFVEGFVLLLRLVVEELAGIEGLADGFAKVLEGLLSIEATGSGTWDR